MRQMEDVSVGGVVFQNDAANQHDEYLCFAGGAFH